MKKREENIKVQSAKSRVQRVKSSEQFSVNSIHWKKKGLNGGNTGSLCDSSVPFVVNKENSELPQHSPLDPLKAKSPKVVCGGKGIVHGSSPLLAGGSDGLKKENSTVQNNKPLGLATQTVFRFGRIGNYGLFIRNH